MKKVFSLIILGLVLVSMGFCEVGVSGETILAYGKVQKIKYNRWEKKQVEKEFGKKIKVSFLFENHKMVIHHFKDGTIMVVKFEEETKEQINNG